MFAHWAQCCWPRTLPFIPTHSDGPARLHLRHLHTHTHCTSFHRSQFTINFPRHVHLRAFHTCVHRYMRSPSLSHTLAHSSAEIHDLIEREMSTQGGKRGFPGDSVVKNPPADAGDSGLIPRLRRILGEGNGNPLHYSCLENPTDRGAWQAAVHRAHRVRYN